eukprot:CAMPEP_0182472532 /NCGR_PEP_ID=MMETSP1319-20130603/22288_1 /TAXON_ID=172717 /ORGANISM="Bolidomonas pacifica, Strain RCC208" /LENGTH=427 /DNA_ID=CAMNT_0024673225 /DNA_START=143 /DNA_END=1423 /DNA_ORIENTATION=+
MSTQLQHGYLLAMPLLCLNMGVEMIYILQQRLAAQSVKPAKATKVLQDVIRTMFSETFISELFRPQEMYTSSSTRQIFNKLAHSSIMRINETSMDKLYDLMTMGVKYQFLSCNCPQQLLQVTFNHLSSIVGISKGSDCMTLVESTMTLLTQTYSTMTPGNWSQLKQQVSIFFQGRKVKVSLFLQANIQAMDGTLSIDTTGHVAKGTSPPGTIKVLKGKSSGLVKTFTTKSCQCQAPTDALFFNHYDHLGSNAYQKDNLASSHAAMEKFWTDNPRGAQVQEALLSAIGGEDSIAASYGGGGGGSQRGESKGADSDEDEEEYKTGPGGGPTEGYLEEHELPTRPKRLASAAEEFNLLADLMGTGATKSDDSDVKPIKMTFDNFVLEPSSDDEGTVRTQVFDNTRTRASMEERFESLGFDDDGGEGKAEG